LRKFLTAEWTISELTEVATSLTHDITSASDCAPTVSLRQRTLDAKLKLKFIIKRETIVLCLKIHFSVVSAPILDISMASEINPKRNSSSFKKGKRRISQENF
jgi:hypothetical protein